jgi:glycosyltransferase involved in cell wall biosynthesis
MEIIGRKVRKMLGIEDKIVILFVGNEYKRKGLDKLLYAVSQIDDKADNIRIIIVGESKDRQMTIGDCYTLSEKLKIRKKIIYMGKCNFIEAYFSACDIFILPTHYEPFGLVALEAMAAGKPVIITKYAGASELINDNINGVLLNDPNEITELKTKINDLISSKNKREEIGREAITTAKEYTWDKISKLTYESYKDIGQYQN